MTPADASARRRTGDFNRDFDELSALIERSWRENKEQPLHYTSDFLRSLFEYPGASFELAPAIYRDGRLVAFVAGFPRRVRLAGHSQPVRLLSVSFLTVAPEHKRSGYGPLIWGELLLRARRLGFHGALDFTVEGDPWSEQILPVARVLRQPTAQVFTVPFVARWLKTGESVPVEHDSLADPGTILMEAASRLPENVPLARCWSQAEAEWQCGRRTGALNAVLEIEDRRGLLNGYAIETSGSAPMLTVVLDNILWGNLAPVECMQLAKLLIGKAAQIGARMIVSPVLGYADIQPLAAAGFRKTRRGLRAYLTLWDAPPGESISAMYIDVF
jgi:GNAT superfamily N-acetyltransferase